MNETQEHGVVTAVDWDRVFLFRHLGRALSLSFQPGRVIMGFILIVILMVSGTLWDGFAGANVGPMGLGSDVESAELVKARLNAIATDSSFVGAEAAARWTEAQTIAPLRLRDDVGAHFRSLDAELRKQRLDEFDHARYTIELVRPRGTYEATVQFIKQRFSDITAGLVQLNPGEALSRLVGLCRELPRLLWTSHPWFLVIFGSWTTLVLLIGCCAISRSAACQFAIEQYLPWTTVVAFALKRWLPLAGTIILPAAALGLGVVALAIGGLVMAIPGLNLIGGLLYAIALIGGLLAAFIIVLWVVSCGLFVPAVAVESADAPDALSRAFSYVRNRPLHWILYVAISLVVGALGLVIIEWIAVITLNFTAAGAGILTDPSSLKVMHGARMTSILGEDVTWQLTGTHRITGSLLMVWRTVVAGLVAGWVIAFDSCACTVIYFLMRRSTDGQELEEIWQPGLIEGTMAPDRASVESESSAGADSE